MPPNAARLLIPAVLLVGCETEGPSYPPARYRAEDVLGDFKVDFKVDRRKDAEEVLRELAPEAQPVASLLEAQRLLDDGDAAAAVEVLEQLKSDTADPSKACAVTGMLALASAFSQDHREHGERRLEAYRDCRPKDRTTLETVEDLELEAHVFDLLQEDRQRRQALKNIVKMFEQPDATEPELALRLAEAHLGLADLNLDAGRTKAASRAAHAALELCTRVREADTEPYVEDTQWGAIAYPESPNGREARICEGEAFAVEAELHTRAKDRRQALEAVEACVERLFPSGFFEGNSTRCPKYATHWALEGDDLERARSVAKQYTDVLEGFPAGTPGLTAVRASHYARLGEYEIASGSREFAKHHLMRALDLAKSAEDPELQKSVTAKLATLDAQG